MSARLVRGVIAPGWADAETAGRVLAAMRALLPEGPVELRVELPRRPLTILRLVMVHRGRRA